MSTTPPDQKRSHYRLRYPVTARPRVRIDGREAEVVELSEAGARVARLDGVGPGRRLVGLVHFADGQTARVGGEVVRVDGEEVVLRLTTGVALGRMIAEQRRLIREFPRLTPDPAAPADPGPG